MRGVLAFIFFCFSGSEVVNGSAVEDDPWFRLHLLSETMTLDPARARGSSGSYLFHNLHRGLFSYDRELGLIPEGAKSCDWVTPFSLDCSLNDRLWSDGSPIKAEDYLRTFRRLLNPKLGSGKSEFLLSLQNARDVLAEKKPSSALGVRHQQRGEISHLIFSLAEPDSDFLYKLSHPFMSPTPKALFPDRTKAHTMPTSGPYKIKSWRPGKSVIIETNDFYLRQTRRRPTVEYKFVEDDSTALRLYEAGKLSFLRRLPSRFIGKYRGRKDFFQIPLARFDMIGFGPGLQPFPELRKYLTQSVSYLQLKNILYALGKPGCPSLPRSYLSTQPCYYSKSMEVRIKKAAIKKPDKISFGFSKMGGDDIKRQVEWFQNQWGKSLDLKFELLPSEQGVYIHLLRSEKRPDLFRKGLSLDIPSCHSALVTLTPGHPENYIRYNNQRFNKIVSRLKKTTSQDLRKILCSQAMKVLLDDHVMIPMGEIHFTVLANKKWTGWRLNELNQLDLTDLKPVSE